MPQAPVGNYIERQECKRGFFFFFSDGVLAWLCAVCQTPSGSSPGGVGVEGVKSASLVRHAVTHMKIVCAPALATLLLSVLEKRVFQFMRKTLHICPHFQSRNVKTFYSFWLQMPQRLVIPFTCTQINDEKSVFIHKRRVSVQPAMSSDCARLVSFTKHRIMPGPSYTMYIDRCPIRFPLMVACSYFDYLIDV